MIYKWIFSLFIASFCISNGAFCEEISPDLKATNAITQLLNQWSKDFNEKNLQGVCHLFAPDVIASYPGTKDRNYSDMCQQFSNTLKNSKQLFQYQEPEIEQIVIKDDIAIVRLIWTLKIRDLEQPIKEIIRERGMDIFKKQKDGSWKIMISYAYPEN